MAFLGVSSGMIQSVDWKIAEYMIIEEMALRTCILPILSHIYNRFSLPIDFGVNYEVPSTYLDRLHFSSFPNQLISYITHRVMNI